MNQFILLFVFLFSTNLFAQAPTYVPKNGLMGWWGFNGNANDESGNGNHGIMYNVIPAKDRNNLMGGCFQFEKTGSKIVISDSPLFNNKEVSISLWVKSYGLSQESYIYKVQENTANHEV